MIVESKSSTWNENRTVAPHGKLNMKTLPMISIVTPSFNQATFILEALQSIQIQDYSNYEHLIIDGLSTDGTVNLLEDLSNTSQDSRVHWLSEKDEGQSEALNKGFRQAKGDIIGWLNSDDRYLPGCFARIVQAFEQNPTVDIIYGDYRVVDESGGVIRIKHEIDFSKFILLYHRVLYIPTTATFFRSRVFREDNWLDESLQYAMDLDFFIRLAEKGYQFKHISEVLADFRLQPYSKTCSAPEKQRLEHQQIVYSAAPMLRNIESPSLRSITLFLLRFMAATKRSLEKMVRGYYWSQGSLPQGPYLPRGRR